MQYISLGCDCSVTYQLRKYGLQTMGTMPFDWMKLDKLQDLIAILDNNFMGFEKFDNYTVKSQSDNFINMDGVNMGSEKVLSRRKLIHNKYKFILPHEYMNDILDIEQFETKYARRIIRFRTLVTDSSIKKIFVRLCGDKETREKSNYVKNKIYLEECLARYGCVNFKVIVINYNDYDSLIPDKYTWQRDYIPWSEVLELDLK
jgi:hypothetical protein